LFCLSSLIAQKCYPELPICGKHPARPVFVSQSVRFDIDESGDGDYVPIEINCRPPGASILNMMNYSIDDDLYRAYALMIADVSVLI